MLQPGLVRGQLCLRVAKLMVGWSALRSITQRPAVAVHKALLTSKREGRGGPKWCGTRSSRLSPVPLALPFSRNLMALETDSWDGSRIPRGWGPISRASPVFAALYTKVTFWQIENHCLKGHHVLNVFGSPDARHLAQEALEYTQKTVYQNWKTQLKICVYI